MKRLLILILAVCAITGSSCAAVIVIGSLARTTTIYPGAPFEGVIFLKNTGTQPADTRVSQADCLFRADGSNEYGEPGKAPRSNAGWMTVSPTQLKIAPGETLPVRYKGRVPANSRLRGTFWSMIMIQPSAAPASTPDGKMDPRVVVVQSLLHYAIQIVTEIGESGTRSLQVKDRRIVLGEGKRALQLDIANDGERLLMPMMTVELFDRQRVSIGRFDAGRARIFPMCSVRARIDLTGVPPGTYAAMMLLDSGDAQVTGAQYDLEIEANGAR
jgi:hypothetical protein